MSLAGGGPAVESARTDKPLAVWRIGVTGRRRDQCSIAGWCAGAGVCSASARLLPGTHGVLSALATWVGTFA